MWGSSFADLAKAAADLQEQATAATASMSTPSGAFSSSSFFNMDGLQETEELQEKKIPQAKATHAEQAMGDGPPALTVKPLRLPTVTMAGPSQVSPPIAKGKLVMPVKPNTKAPLLQAPAVMSTSTSTTASTTQGRVGVSPKPSVPKPVEVASATMESVAEPPLESSLLKSTTTTTITESSKLQPPLVVEAAAPSTSSELVEEQSSSAAPEPLSKEVMDQTTTSTTVSEPVMMETMLPENQGGEDQEALELAWQNHLENQKTLAPREALDLQKENSNSQGSISNDDDDDDDDDDDERPHKTPKEPHMGEPPRPPHMDHDEDKDARGSSQNSGLTSPFVAAQEQVLSQMDRDLSPPQSPRSKRDALQLDAYSTQLPAAAMDSSEAKEAVPEHMLEQFSKQLKRLEENHQAERAVMEQELDGRMQQAMEKQRQELEVQTHATQQKLQHDMERQFEEQRGEWKRQKEGYTLRLDSLTRERDGTQELLEESQREKRRMQDGQLKELRNMEKKMNAIEAEKDRHEARVKELEKNLDETSNQVGSSNEAYNELKARVKVVAAELMERRIECRELKSHLDDQTGENEGLRDKITSLEAQGMDKDQSTTETQQELNDFRGQLMDREQELAKAQKGIDEERRKGEEGLAAYKKKAQNSMSVSNGRTASAVQAKEEAEMEARAARSTADSAMTRALVAEKNGNEALAEAKAYVKDMEAEVAKLNEIQSTLDTVKVELEKAQAAATETKSANDKLECELQTLSNKSEAEQNTTQVLQNDLKAAQGRSNELAEEMDRLRREVQKAQTELKKASAEKKEATDNTNSNGYSAVHVVKPVKADNSEAESTIMMLRQELDDANQAIKELKETLRSEVERKEDTGGAPSAVNGDVHSNGGQPNGAMPLFYAMEKQAELAQARNEIARLAGLLGDAESSKQEAIDNVEDFRLEMEQFRARARREQQLGGPSEAAAKQQEKDGGSVNLEYLKNVVLSYLNAKTVQEKKTLLPVIGTVLCLTGEEQKKAIDALDQSGGVIDTISSSMLTNFKWS